MKVTSFNNTIEPFTDDGFLITAKCKTNKYKIAVNAGILTPKDAYEGYNKKEIKKLNSISKCLKTIVKSSEDTNKDISKLHIIVEKAFKERLKEIVADAPFKKSDKKYYSISLSSFKIEKK